MKSSILKCIGTISTCTLLAGLAACGGGTKLLKEPEPLEVEGSLASTSDDRLTATLDWVIVRDGQGTWARNADWDQYLMRVRNLSGEPVKIESITVFDSMLTPHEATPDRKKLVKASRGAARRYADADIKVKAGVGGGSLLVAGGVASTVGMGAGAAAMYGGTAAVGATAGALVLAPVLVAGGVVRMANNSRVNSEIDARSTELPLVIGAEATESLSFFFPITPSPARIELHYSSAGEAEVLTIDTAEALHGLHIAAD